MESIAYLKHAMIYQQERPVLEQVNLSVSPSEFVYLVGKTGSGKSSLLKTLWGELPLLEGEGRVAEFQLHTLPEKEVHLLRRRLGIVFQDFRLFHEWTVADNLRFVLEATGWTDRKEVQLRMEKVLKDVGLLEALQTPAHKLSGGEQQRVVIARAMLNNPVLILADEPTGNLDPDTSDEILHLMRQLAMDYKTAILMATHDFRMLQKFPGRVYRCEGGRVLEID